MSQEDRSAIFSPMMPDTCSLSMLTLVQWVDFHFVGTTVLIMAVESAIYWLGTFVMSNRLKIVRHENIGIRFLHYDTSIT